RCNRDEGEGQGWGACSTVAARSPFDSAQEGRKEASPPEGACIAAADCAQWERGSPLPMQGEGQGEGGRPRRGAHPPTDQPPSQPTRPLAGGRGECGRTRTERAVGGESQNIGRSQSGGGA